MRFILIIFIFINILVNFVLADTLPSQDLVNDWKFKIETRLGIDQISRDQFINNTTLGLYLTKQKKFDWRMNYSLQDNSSSTSNYTNMNFDAKIDLFFSPTYVYLMYKLYEYSGSSWNGQQTYGLGVGRKIFDFSVEGGIDHEDSRSYSIVNEASTNEIIVASELWRVALIFDGPFYDLFRLREEVGYSKSFGESNKYKFSTKSKIMKKIFTNVDLNLNWETLFDLSLPEDRQSQYKGYISTTIQII